MVNPLLSTDFRDWLDKPHTRRTPIRVRALRPCCRSHGGRATLREMCVRTSRSLCLALMATLISACGRAEIDDPALKEAVTTTVSALRTRDFSLLWSLTDSSTSSAFRDALKDLETAWKRAPEVWLGKDLEAARAALGGMPADKLGPDDDGRGARGLELFLDLSRLTFDEGTLEGLGARSVTYEPGPPRRAFLVTTAGERLAFVEQDGKWKSLLVRELVLDSTPFKSLLENAHKTLALADEAHRVWVSNADPATPQGAFNLARAAQTRNPPDLDMLFALIDKDGRAALAEVLESGRKAQRQIQQKVARPDRRAAYESAKIATLVDAGSDRELFRKWASSTDWKPLIASVGSPDRLDGDPASGSVVIITVEGGRVPMQRDPDSIWRIAGLRPAIVAALSPPSP
jgi:hypothetical protein